MAAEDPDVLALDSPGRCPKLKVETEIPWRKRVKTGSLRRAVFDRGRWNRVEIPLAHDLSHCPSAGGVLAEDKKRLPGYKEARPSGCRQSRLILIFT